MWLLPLILLGVALYAAAGRERGAAAHPLPQRALPAPPGPIAVLGEFVRIGQFPPPPVILCAIAEAEAIGRIDLATDIIRAFVAPVVQARAQPSPQQQPYLQPQATARSVQERIYAPSFRQEASRQMPHTRGSCARAQSPRAPMPRGQTNFAASPTPQQLSPRHNPMADEIQRMLDSDPERSIAALTLDALSRTANNPAALSKIAQESGLNDLADAAGIDRGAMAAAAFMAAANAAANAAAVATATTPTSPPEPMQRPSGDFDTQPGSDWDHEFPVGHPLSPQPNVGPVGFPTYDEWYEAIGRPSGMPYDPPYAEPTTASPLVGISDDAWSNFCGKLVRETPAYQSARHVGQYRQRRERLTELGIDPDSIVGSAAMQRAALDADLADAYRHAADEASGLVQNVSRRIILPNQGDPATITLSGVLGVIQAAGLEGAVGWLKNPRDRKRFPHTTQAFVRCNGVF